MNTSRRQFIGGLTGVLAVSGCRCSWIGGTERPRIALQLYSIHKIFWKSPEKILAELKASGYDGVEFAGTDGRTAANIRKLLGDAGMVGAGAHVNGDVEFADDALRRTLDYHAEAGILSVVTPHAARKTADEYRRFGARMGAAAEEAAKYGIKLGVHTAPFHFNQRLEGKTPWEWITSESSPLLQQEIDVGNVMKGGADPVSVLAAGRGRHFVLHMKENDPTPHGIFGEKPTDGSAGVPWEKVLAFVRSDDSVRWLVVEAEQVPDSLEPAKICCEKLESWQNQTWG